MSTPITRRRFLESLKEAGSWPAADRNIMVNLAIAFIAARADAEAAGYFAGVADARPQDASALALTGFFQARTGRDTEDALGLLDKAATMDLGLPQYFRGLALADRLDGTDASKAAEQAAADLEFVLAVRSEFPPGLLRAAFHGLARAYRQLGREDEAEAAQRSSGLSPADDDPRLIFTSFSVTARDGMRMAPPRILRAAPGVSVATSYDFGDFAFVQTAAGIVAIDAGTSAERVRSALADLAFPADQPITHVIVTHAHFDHVGGIAALLGPGTQVIASAGFPAEQERQRHWSIPFRNFTGTGASPIRQVEPDALVSETTSVTVGGVEFRLIPTTGGETPDALMVYLPASGLLFTGDVMMPYTGAPFTAEGSPEGMLATLRTIRELGPQRLIHGHVPLTENFTVEALAGLEPALADLHEFVLARIGENLTLPEILDRGYLPSGLREHPAATLPYLVIRDHFTERLHHQRTGYWQPDGHGLDPRSAGDWAAALDLLAGGNPAAFARTAATLADQGDLGLALDIARAGELRHPGSTELDEVRRRVLGRLMEQHQVSDPFKFLVYAELAGAEVSPVA
jgi:glyoxylase-like metal-dependent hydrolase (beta-lactamase superfamily II)